MGAARIAKLDSDELSERLLSAPVAASKRGGHGPIILGKPTWATEQEQSFLSGGWTDTRLTLVSRRENIPESDDETRTLLVSIAEGDRSAFWTLWQQHQKHLFAVCLRQMGGVHADAEDALSKAMLKALDTMPRHSKCVINAKAWLTRLTSNVCIEMHREHSRRRAKVSSEKGLAGVERPIHTVPTPEDALLRGEIYAFVARTIDRLAGRLREPFVLRFEHEMSCREVGERLMLSSENVRKRIQQARAVLREEMARFLSGLAVEPPRPAADGAIGNPHLCSAAPHPQSTQESANHSGLIFSPSELTVPHAEAPEFYLAMKQRPARQHLKLRTLKKYLERHPRGWKKRLETAYLLYTMGQWEEAIGHYRYVLRRQPKLADAWINLANILRVTHRGAEAIAAYQTALTLVTRATTRHALSELILMCLEDYDGLNAPFEDQSSLEPAYEPCWPDLGTTFCHSTLAKSIAGD